MLKYFFLLLIVQSTLASQGSNLTAITRRVSPAINQCELLFVKREPIDVAKAYEEHNQYVKTLEALGVNVITLPAENGMPDSVFMQDPGVIFDEIAVLSSMGATSRRAETALLRPIIERLRPTTEIQTPATLEGGDIVTVGKTVYVGVSGRTNIDGITQLRRVLEPFGYRIVEVKVHGCLHLTTGCTYVGRNTLLANPNWIEIDALNGAAVVPVHSQEPFAANALLIGNTVVFQNEFPRTRELLEKRGFNVVTVKLEELMKAEAGLTCLSLVFNTAACGIK